ncbi:hypothetical protein [Demetria terragena]|uniref:hypothetical protein n=1 Tax=Demetria terragena TaxID=63959 RepID=UPI0003757BB9|nr:hypothetical protein [Demetria terragena]
MLTILVILPVFAVLLVLAAGPWRRLRHRVLSSATALLAAAVLVVWIHQAWVVVALPVLVALFAVPFHLVDLHRSTARVDRGTSSSHG